MGARLRRLLALLVALVGVAGAYRYVALEREYPEAAGGFRALLAGSLLVLAVFLMGVAVLERGEGEEERGGAGGSEK